MEWIILYDSRIAIMRWCVLSMIWDDSHKDPKIGNNSQVTIMFMLVHILTSLCLRAETSAKVLFKSWNISKSEWWKKCIDCGYCDPFVTYEKFHFKLCSIWMNNQGSKCLYPSIVKTQKHLMKYSQSLL
jgi:hypothetical protein